MGWFHPLISQWSDYSCSSGGQNHEAHLDQVDTPDFRWRGSAVGKAAEWRSNGIYPGREDGMCPSMASLLQHPRGPLENLNVCHSSGLPGIELSWSPCKMESLASLYFRNVDGCKPGGERSGLLQLSAAHLAASRDKVESVCMEGKHTGKGPQIAKNCVRWCSLCVINPHLHAVSRNEWLLPYTTRTQMFPSTEDDKAQEIAEASFKLKSSSLGSNALITELWSWIPSSWGTVEEGRGESMRAGWLSDSKWSSSSQSPGA